MRTALLLTMVLLVPSAVASGIAIASVERPERTMAERPFAASVSIRNDRDADATVVLLAALYEPKQGATCGPSTDPRFRGFTPFIQARVTVPAHGSATYPPPGDLPWLQRYHADGIPSAPAPFDWCVFVAEDATGATIRYEDVASRTLWVRANDSPPVASFRVEPDPPVAAIDARFVAEATDAEGDPVSFSWDFGHANASGARVATGAEAAHAFYPAGPYTVTLTASDGFADARVVRAVVVREEPTAGVPTARASHTVSGDLAVIALGAAGLARAVVTRVPPKRE